MTLPVFRVFVSSTFADMRRERGLLQRAVFPRVEDFCRAKGLSFQAVDLRWGIPEELQLRHQTMEMCLEEIARCQAVSPKPNFLVLVGDRYGWQPAPAVIPEADWTELLPQLDPAGRRLLERWFRRDDNAIPAEFILQPRGGEHRDYLDWEPVEAAILATLRRAATPAGISGARASRYFTSATHQEILRGILKPPDDLAEDPANHVFAYVRRTRPGKTALTANGEATGELADFGRTRLEELRAELETRLGATGHYREYSAVWAGGQARLDAENEFVERVYRDLVETIDSRLRSERPSDPRRWDREAHRRHRDKLCLEAIPRQPVLAQLRACLRGTAARPVRVVGKAGAGKSTVLAQLAAELEAEGASVHYRFVGATANSAAVGLLVRSLLEELAPEGSRGAASAAESEPRLEQLLAEASARAGGGKPVILLIDGVDQLSTEREREGGWLPQALPSGVHLVVSQTAAPEPGTVLVPKLTRAEGQAVLEHWLGRMRRRLTPTQSNRVLERFASTGLPLYLRFAFERVRAARSYDEAPALAQDLESALDQYFADLQHECGAELVARTIGYLVSGRYRGLTEAELLEVLPRDEDVWREFLESCHPDTREEVGPTRRLPGFVWSRLRLALEPYLAEVDCYGATLLTLFHPQLLVPVAERRFLSEPKGQGTVGEYCHQRLAAYWGSKPSSFGGPSPTPNRRKLVEWPWQLVESHDRWSEAVAAFEDVEFVRACRDAGLWWELYPALMHALITARQLGSYQAANRFSELTFHLNAIAGLSETPEPARGVQADHLHETVRETIARSDAIWFKRDPVALELANQGGQHLSAGQIEKGLKLLREAVARDPDCELAHFNLGAEAFNGERWEDASRHYREVLRINPENREVKAALAQIERYRAAAVPPGQRGPQDYVREAMRVVNLRGEVRRGEQLLLEGLTRYPGDAAIQRALESLRRMFDVAADRGHQQFPPPLRVTRGPEPPPPTRGPSRRPGVSGTQGEATKRGIGRNEPCPCGSGKKYGRCHGAKPG